MAAENGRMASALTEQQGKMAALMERAARYEAQSRGAMEEAAARARAGVHFLFWIGI